MIEARTSTVVPRTRAWRRGATPVTTRVVVVSVAVATAVDASLIAAGGVVDQPAGYAALIAEQVVAFAGAALFWRGYRPGSRIGGLLLAGAALSAGQGLQGSSTPVVHS